MPQRPETAAHCLESALAITALPAGSANLEPNLSVGQQKVQLLMRDAEFHARLQPVAQLLPLAGNTDGTYSANYAGTDLTGSYMVVFEIDGNHPVIGLYQRTEKRSTVVHFGVPDLESSDVRIVDTGTDPPNEFVKLRIRPRDRLGNFLGPDYGRRIAIDLSAGSVTQTLEDPGDGSYIVKQLADGRGPYVECLIHVAVPRRSNYGLLTNRAASVSAAPVRVLRGQLHVRFGSSRSRRSEPRHGRKSAIQNLWKGD